MENLRFRTNSKLEKLIGRELITNNTIALFELIKNSYDAGANKVKVVFKNFTNYNINEKNKFTIDNQVVSGDTIVSIEDSYIIVSDNGKGMSLNEVKKYWMEIGTVNKEIIKKTEIKQDTINKMYTRILNGEKGIGRFGTDKLGEKLVLKAIKESGDEKTTVYFDWGDFDDHSKLIQDIDIYYDHEYLEEKHNSGVTLKISNLRDEWTIKDIESIKKHLKKFISPFVQEQDTFSIIFGYNDRNEKINNDAFDFSNTYIEAKIDNKGLFTYKITDNIDVIVKDIQKDAPIFGSVNLKILYMDRAAKVAFTKRLGITARDYGNIKLFRDSFRILPYGEANNDWLGIDNKHAQAVFRSLGTRDIIGYVQISNIGNERLKDATNRNGLIEDTAEFGMFKSFIWDCIYLLQDHIFYRIKSDSEKQGKIIQEKVIDINLKTQRLMEDFHSAINTSQIPKLEAKALINVIDNNVKKLKDDIKIVETANKQLTNRMKVFERIMGSGGIMYDILHVIKNKISIIDTQVFSVSQQAKRANLDIDTDAIRHSFKVIKTLVSTALRKASTTKLKKESHILSELILEAIRENKLMCTVENIIIKHKFDDNYQRIFCNKESFKIVLDNLFNNSFKVLKDRSNKEISIYTYIKNSNVEIVFCDSGPGIPDDVIPFVFNVGYSKTGGSGLGLSASLEIMEDLEGDILVAKDIDSELKGACFLIKTPIYRGL